VVAGNHLPCCCYLRGAGGSGPRGSRVGALIDQCHAPALPVCSPPPSPVRLRVPALGRAWLAQPREDQRTSKVVEKGFGVYPTDDSGADFSHVVLQYGFKTEAPFKCLIRVRRVLGITLTNKSFRESFDQYD